MAKLKCEDCGEIFEEEDLASWQEDRGEFWGSKCFETMTGCPHCYSGDVVEYFEEDEDDEEGEEE